MRAAELLNASEFWQSLNQDVPRAKSRVIVHSPFLHPRRLASVARLFSPLRDRGVVTCLTTQMTEGESDIDQINDELTWEPTKTSIDTLMSWLVHINPLKFHHKFVLIDGRILYYGSMNVFSHYKTSECMRRTEDPDEIFEAIRKFNLDDCEECMKNEKQLWGNAPIDKPSAQFGILVQKQRLKLKLSKLDVQKLSGVAHQTIAKIEQGENCKIESIIAVFRALGLKFAIVPADAAPAVLNITRDYWNEIPNLDQSNSKRSKKPSKKDVEKSDFIIVPSSQATPTR